MVAGAAGGAAGADVQRGAHGLQRARGGGADDAEREGEAGAGEKSDKKSCKWRRSNKKT